MNETEYQYKSVRKNRILKKIDELEDLLIECRRKYSVETRPLDRERLKKDIEQIQNDIKYYKNELINIDNESFQKEKINIFSLIGRFLIPTLSILLGFLLIKNYGFLVLIISILIIFLEFFSSKRGTVTINIFLIISYISNSIFLYISKIYSNNFDTIFEILEHSKKETIDNDEFSKGEPLVNYDLFIIAIHYLFWILLICTLIRIIILIVKSNKK